MFIWICISGGIAFVGFIYLIVRGQRQDQVADEPIHRQVYEWEVYYDPYSE